ncbi:LbtU family siderophore porin [Pseudomonadota bacterium]
MKKLTYLSLPALAVALPLTASAADIEVSGAIEVEASFGDSYAGTDSSDITLATVELGFDSQINDRVSAHLLMLHEDDDTEPMEVDEGIISIDMGNGWAINAGRMYVPFGAYETNLVSDPLTLEIGETREAAVQLAFEKNNFYGSVYAFNGDTIETSTATAGDDTIEHTGGSIGYLWETDSFSLDIGLDYISSIGDSDAISAALPDANTDSVPDSLSSYVGGTVFHWIYSNDEINFIVEYLQSDTFQSTELAFKGLGAQPSALNVEFAYGFDWGTAAVALQSTDEALALGLPETRAIIGASIDIDEQTTLGVEYLSDEDYSTADGGTGKDASTITVQLAVAF